MNEPLDGKIDYIANGEVYQIRLPSVVKKYFELYYGTSTSDSGGEVIIESLFNGSSPVEIPIRLRVTYKDIGLSEMDSLFEQIDFYNHIGYSGQDRFWA